MVTLSTIAQLKKENQSLKSMIKKLELKLKAQESIFLKQLEDSNDNFSKQLNTLNEQFKADRIKNYKLNLRELLTKAYDLNSTDKKKLSDDARNLIQNGRKKQNLNDYAHQLDKETVRTAIGYVTDEKTKIAYYELFELIFPSCEPDDDLLDLNLFSLSF